jgi:uncharacterized protein (TIGR03437 family)
MKVRLPVAAYLATFLPLFAPALRAQVYILNTLNALSDQAGSISPGEIVALLGVDFTGIEGLSYNCAADPLPTKCGLTQVLVNGQPAPILFLKYTQLVFQAPVNLSGSTATIQVNVGGTIGSGSAAPVTVPVAPVAPGLISNMIPVGYSDLTLTSPSGNLTAINALKPGDFVSVPSTGFGVFNPPGTTGVPTPEGATLVANVTATISGQAVPVQVTPSASDAGIVLVSVSIPPGSHGLIPLVVTVNGVATNTVDLPALGVSSALNAASGGANAAAGSWVAIYGAGLSLTTRTWQPSDFSGNTLPTTLDGVSVFIDGKSAPVYYIGPYQLNVIAPAGTATGPVPVEVITPNGTFNTTLTLEPYAPAFFDSQIYDPGAVLPAAVFAEPGPYGPVYLAGSPPSGTQGPAKSGDTILLFGTGFGPTSPPVDPGQIVQTPAPIPDLSQLQVLVGGVPATVLYAGITYAGEFQLNVQLPTLPNGNQPITAEIGGVSTQSGLSIPIQN